MTVRLIVAVSLNGVIGVGSDLPWRLKSDLKLFKELTTGRVVVMGRKTFESIGRPLPNRVNVVISRTMPKTDGVIVLRSIDDVKPLLNGEVDIIGGQEIYKAMLENSFVDELIVTHVNCSVATNKCRNVARFETSYLDGFTPLTMIANVEADIDNEFSFKTYRYIRG